MIVGDSGQGGTNWYALGMEDIQFLANSADLGMQDQIADGWSKSADLLAMHLGEVQNYRNALAEAWPPNKSKAADAYLTKLDVMIDSLTQTFNATISNGQALQAVNASLAEARTQVNQIHAQWQANNQTLAAFTQKQQQQKASGQPTPSLSPSGDEPPPVTAAQQDALKLQAVKIMSKVSTDLSQAQLQLVTPDVFDPAALGVEKGTQTSGAAFAAPPVLPPIVPASYAGGGGSASGVSSGSAHASTPFPTSSSGTPGVGPGSLPGSNGGHPNLVLGGANPPSLTPTPPVTNPNPGPIPTLPNPGNGPVTNPGLFPPGSGPFPGDGFNPPAKGGGFPGGGGFPDESDALKSIGRGGFPEGGLRAMPPGGIIGQAPGGALGEPSATRFGAQRINPVGGVIEPGAQGTRAVGGFGGEGMIGGPGGMGGVGGARGGNAGSPLRPGARGGVSEQQPYGQFGGRRAGRRNNGDEQHWDPDNPWATEVGVDPVVLPAAEQRVDPGPAIGLR